MKVLLAILLTAWVSLSFAVQPEQITIYGYTKFDICYDTDRINDGNYARWVEAGEDENIFNATARQTRLGLNMSGLSTEKTKTSGKVELDFFGGGAENKNTPMMRHAFMKLEWPEHNLSLLAGQTSDVISPLVPTTVNYPVLWWAGDIGYRRPQLRVSKGFGQSDLQLHLEAALARATGDEEGNPNVQGRAAVSFPLLTDKQTTLGASGHYGQSEGELKTWSANTELVLPIAKQLALNAEAWTGENMDDFLGGIAQGIRFVDKDGDGTKETPNNEIASMGGWAAITVGPFGQWQFNLGGSVDDPDDADLDDGARARNLATFGNVLFEVNKAAQIGVEVSYWETKYKNQEDRTSLRGQSSFRYQF